jgi:hypothetical protein
MVTQHYVHALGRRFDLRWAGFGTMFKRLLPFAPSDDAVRRR